MADPVQGLREMRRVTRPGGTVAACVWDHAGDRGPLAALWSTVRELDPADPGESDLTGVREGQLASRASGGAAHPCGDGSNAKHRPARSALPREVDLTGTMPPRTADLGTCACLL
jgi:hypothetical protein